MTDFGFARLFIKRVTCTWLSHMARARKEKSIVLKSLKRLYKIFAVLLLGFSGGAMSPWILGWIRSVNVPDQANAIGIANTYIVFTTIIFVGVTVILAITGYVFTQQFSANKESQLSLLIEEMREKIRSEESFGISLANAILENSDVKRHLDVCMSKKLAELISEQQADAERCAVDAAKRVESVKSIADQLSGNGGKQ